MSYDFVAASSQYILSNASFAAITLPVTLSCWMRPDLTGTSRYSFSLSRASLASSIGLGQDATNYLCAIHNYGPTNGISQYTTSTLTVGTWYHVLGIFTSGTSRTVYVDGVAGTTNTTTVTVAAGFDRPTVGCRNRNTSYDSFFDGKVAECAVWNVSLTTDEIISLSKGFKPTLIRPQSLKYYAPLAGNANNFKDNVAPTLTNGPTIDGLHPRRYG